MLSSYKLLDGCLTQRQKSLEISPELAAILNPMVRYDFRECYSTAAEALEALAIDKALQFQPDYQDARSLREQMQQRLVFRQENFDG